MGVGADGIAGEACDMAAAFISGHIFRATGVIADLKNGGTLEKAARMVKSCFRTLDAALRPLRRGK
jgi:hypothetical protein